MDGNVIDRRQFLQSGVIAATLAATGRLPLLAAEPESGSGIDTSAGQHAAKPIRGYLQSFLPAEKTLRGRKEYSLKYSIVHWNGGTRTTDKMSNSVVGNVAIKRTAADGRLIYEVKQHMQVGGVDNLIEARIVCNADECNSLREWKLHASHTKLKGGVDPLSEIRENGNLSDGSIRINGEHYCKYSKQNPVVTQWTVLDFLIRRANPQLSATFDLLQDLSLFKPGQSLVYDGPMRVTLKDKQTVTLQTYAQTGEGILPIHYLLDAKGCPQLITSSMLSWALSG